jgi:hypothetical protein
MAHTAFFAWQLDTPAEQNKKFIWNALVSATNTTASSAIPEESPRPESDTLGVAGSPNVVDTIFNRIRECAFFVADLTFTSKTESGKIVPNPNVLIELGYAARSVGWERTILVMNDFYGTAKQLPFDILQHRWPIEYRMSDRTIVGEKRFEQLSDALSAAITSCEAHMLSRAEEMADSLDTATIDIISQYENASFIDMRLPSKTMGQLLSGLDHILAIRQLILIGAIRVTNTPTIGYKWTYDGRRMIDVLSRKHPRLLEIAREHRQGQVRQ